MKAIFKPLALTFLIPALAAFPPVLAQPDPGALEGPFNSFAPPPEFNPTAPDEAPPLDPRLVALDGIWEAEGPLPGVDGTGVPFTPESRERLAAYQDRGPQEDTSNWARCIPNGAPMMMSGRIDIVAAPGALDIFATDHGFERRHIFVDGREHTPIDFLFDTYGGESVGRWEEGGDSLMVDTITLDSNNEIVPGVDGDSMQVVERFSLREDGRLVVEFTITDRLLTEPWTFTRTYVRSNLPALPENYCLIAPRPDDPEVLELLGIPN